VLAYAVSDGFGEFGEKVMRVTPAKY